MLLQHFWLGLSKESALQLDITARGSFTHKTTEGGATLLDRILENTPSLEPLRVEPMLSHEEASSAKAKPTLFIQEPSPKPEDPEEGLQPSNLPPFEDDLFEDFGNTLNYSCQKKPPVPITPIDPVDECFLRENIKELIAIMNSEWVEEAELSSKEIQIHTPSSTIQCQLCRTSVDILYNPMVGENLMSASFAHTYFNDDILAPTTKSCRIAPQTRLEGLGVLHNISLY